MQFPSDCDLIFSLDEEKQVAILDTKDSSELFPYDSPIQIAPLLKKIAWSTVFRNVAVDEGSVRAEEFKTYKLAAELILSEASDFWTLPMKNARANCGFSRRGLGLKDAFLNTPAIIVGAGPSLEKNGHLLEAFTDRALIFASGTAQNLIPCTPHFGASIDKEAPFIKHRYRNTPFCYQARMNPENFSYMQGEKLLFPDSSCRAINWIYDEEMFDGGWTVGNFQTAVADFLGCSPIIFVGMDYAYEDSRKYAQGEVETSGGLVEVNGYLTQRDWQMAALWTEDKGRGKSWINASGRGILNIKTATLDDLIKTLTPKADLNVLGKIAKAPHISPRWDLWDQSFESCVKNFSEDEIVYQELLMPLWQIWRPIFEREPLFNEKEQKKLFFEQVLEEHQR